MKSMKKLAVVFVLAVTCSVFQPAVLWAGEHGGQEHGGTAVTQKEHGGTSQEVSHEKSEADLLLEAAAALRKGTARPDLAKELEHLAEHATGN